MEVVNLQALYQPNLLLLATEGSTHASCWEVKGRLPPLRVWVSASIFLDVRHRRLTVFPSGVLLLSDLCCFLCIMTQRKQRC